SEAGVGVNGKGTATPFSGTTTDSDGRFVISALLDGTYTLSAHRETYSPSSQTVEISSGVAPEVEIKLEGGTAATFIVVDAMTGTSLPMANVTIDSGGKRIAGNMARGDDGTRIWLRPGSYRALASAPGYAQSSPR